MGKLFTQEDYDSVNEFMKSGIEQKEMAKKIGRSPSAVCFLVKEISEGRGYVKKAGGRIELKEREEMDLSQLPDTGMFKHSKEYFL